MRSRHSREADLTRLALRITESLSPYCGCNIAVDLNVGDATAALGERYREEILKELHAYYREEMQIYDYAIRLGELMMLMEVFEVTFFEI